MYEIIDNNMYKKRKVVRLGGPLVNIDLLSVPHTLEIIHSRYYDNPFTTEMLSIELNMSKQATWHRLNALMGRGYVRKMNTYEDCKKIQVYRLTERVTRYLREWETFTNPNGPLVKKITEKLQGGKIIIKEIIKEVEPEPEKVGTVVYRI